MPTGVSRASSPLIMLDHGRHCRDLPSLVESCGFPAAARAAWLHIGPIGRTLMRITAHGDPSFCRRLFGISGTTEVRTWKRCEPFTGFTLHLAGLVGPPDGRRPLASRRLTLGADRSSELYLIYAAAEFRRDGPFAKWKLRPDGRPTLSWTFPDDVPPRYEDLVELGRCVELLRLGNARRGRRPLYMDAVPLDLAEQASALKQAHPWLSYAQIAERLGVGERSLRRYRQLAESDDGPSPTFTRLEIGR